VVPIACRAQSSTRSSEDVAENIAAVAAATATGTAATEDKEREEGVSQGAAKEEAEIRKRRRAWAEQHTIVTQHILKKMCGSELVLLHIPTSSGHMV
jgi:hypothetical protein